MSFYQNTLSKMNIEQIVHSKICETMAWTLNSYNESQDSPSGRKPRIWLFLMSFGAEKVAHIKLTIIDGRDD